MIKRTPLPVYYKNRENVNWKVPALFHYDDIVFLLLEILNELGIKHNIESVYGCVKSRWGGGRPSGWLDIDRETAESIIHKHNGNKVSCSFTFSNYRVTEADFDDKTANLLLDIANQSSHVNYAIVSSDLLADYIKSKYPNIKLISSVLKPMYEIDNCKDTPDYYNKLCEKFDRVVIRPEFAFDNNFLKKLKHKNKIEILVNQDCILNCPLVRKHYDFHTQVELGLKDRSEDFCHVAKRKCESVFNTNLLSNDDINRIMKLGFKNFKLRGRKFTKEQVIELIGLYIFEPTGVYQNIKNRIKLILHGDGAPHFASTAKEL